MFPVTPEPLKHLSSKRDTHNLYVKSCSHEVAKHKSGVICQSDGTTISHNINPFSTEPVLQIPLFSLAQMVHSYAIPSRTK
jgi:hypothetical protein